MPPFLRLSILPLIGCALLLSSVIWSQRELKLRFLGQAAEGQLIGMVLQRAQSADILAGIDTDLLLTLANGDRIQANYSNYELRNSRILSENAEPVCPISAAMEVPPWRSACMVLVEFTTIQPDRRKPSLPLCPARWVTTPLVGSAASAKVSSANGAAPHSLP